MSEGRAHTGEIRWPERWQPEAAEALTRYLGADERVRILLDDPRRARSGSLIEGHVYVENGTPMILHDRIEHPEQRPWELLMGPVQRIELLRPRRRPLLLYEHPYLRRRRR